MSSPVEKIKEKLSIVDVVGSYLTLEKAGANFKARCPFHNEKSASFFISPVRNTYYCFGCGAKGDILSFVQQFEGLDFMGALRVLAQRAGVTLEREDPGVRTERERLYLTMEHATLFFQRALHEKKDAVEYLKKRGLIGETMKQWRLGYAPNEWKSLSTYLKSKGVKYEDMERVGLIKHSEKVKGDVYDRFRGRIMFPIFDSSGRVIAFSGRQFESDGTEAKYLNSPETPLFEKSKILYGFDKAKLEIRRKEYSLLVEGQMDLLMSHQAGFNNAVASSGTALTEHQLEILRRLSNKVVIAYDGDAAGNAAARRGWQLALAQNMDVKIAVLPKGKDPADLILENAELFKKAIDGAQHIIDVELTRIVSEVKDSREKLLKVEKEVLPFIAGLSSEMEKSHFVSKVAQNIGIKDEIIWKEVRKREKMSLNTIAGSTLGEGSSMREKGSLERKGSIERMLIGILLWQEKLSSPVIDTLDIKTTLSNIIGEGRLKALVEETTPVKEELIFEAEISYSNSSNLASYTKELLTHLEEECLRESFSKAMQEMHQAEQAGNTDKVLELLKTCQELSLKLRKLSLERE